MDTAKPKKGTDPGGAVSLPEMQNEGCKMRDVMSAPTDVGGYNLEW
jgi:hypothetical protein